jgi:hypothetical protein
MHKHKKFTLVLKDGTEAEFVSKRYSVKLENKFIELVGNDVWQKHLANGVVNIDILPSKCKEDFPEILTPALSTLAERGKEWAENVAWDECDIYELGAVYFFFFKYRTNVFGTLQNELSGSNLAAMAQLAAASNLIPAGTLEEIKNMLNMDTI